jgi:hypothetical protein
MVIITNDIPNGRFCNQLIRCIATSLVIEKHNLAITYSIPLQLASIGLNLFTGEKKWESTIPLTDSNYFDILNCEKVDKNVDPNGSFFQTREIIQKVCEFICSKKETIISSNQFSQRYNNNNDCFVHIRLSDASEWNPGFEYYDKAIGQLKYDTLYISSDEPRHPLIRRLADKYQFTIIQYNEVDTIKFASTCKYVVLSHGTFSSCIGYFSFYSDIYYPEYANLKRWHGDIFSISGWNRVYFMVSKDDIITSDKYLQAFPDNYYKTDCIVSNTSLSWRDRQINPPSRNQKLIISGHCDYPITDNLVEYFNPSIWWTINKQTTDSRVHSLPLGITNNTNETDLHPIYGNLDCMIEVMNEAKHDKNLVYMNFNISSYPQERQYVFNLFHDKEWVTIGNIENTILGRTNFLREVRNHTFVLCPRGNGIDTHRLWETLYMGSIPIVKRDIAMKDFEDLPICFINVWDEVTPDLLARERERILSTKWCLSKLKVSYWIQKIKDSF